MTKGWTVVFQLHAAALSSLRSEVAELNSRLVAATRAREATEAALVRAEVQAARAEQRAEQQAARHEERLTELHSVIAELGRQLERHRATVIAEEDESGKPENRTTDSVNLRRDQQQQQPGLSAACYLLPTEIYGPRLFDVLTRSPLRAASPFFSPLPLAYPPPIHCRRLLEIRNSTWQDTVRPCSNYSYA